MGMGCVCWRGVGLDSQSHVTPAAPPTDPEKPALLVTRQSSPRLWTGASKASGPQIQLSAPPEARILLLPPPLAPERSR